MPIFNFSQQPNVMQLKSKGDVDGLIEALQLSDDHNVRFEAASALGDVGNSDCIKPLVSALSDNPRVKEVSIRSLGKIGDSQAVPPLLDALNDENWEIRSMAAKALGEIGDPQATGALIEALENDTEVVSWYIVQALANITGQTFDNNIDEWQNWFQQNQI